ncbi:MAG: T9SS type A sorting domain-containing protein [Bacteroidota bacterium]
MKKSILLLLFSGFSFFYLHSQITINSDDIIAVDFVANQTTDTLPDPSILEGGVGQTTWDFTALKDELAAQFVFFEPESTPYAASFPSSNLALEIEPELFAYMIQDDEKIEVIGIEGFQDFAGFALTGKLTVTPGQSLIRFPATFGDQYQEVVVQQGQVPGSDVGFPTIDSVRLTSTVTRIVEIDAYGIMETPVGSYNTIRSTETETTEAVVENLNNGQWVPFFDLSPDTLINYNWWTIEDGLAFPVVQLEFDPANGTREVVWLQELISSVKDFEIHANLYPNPASDYLQIDFIELMDGSIELYNLNGTLAQQLKINRQHNHKIDVSSLQPGVFILLLRDDSNKAIGAKKVEIF